MARARRARVQITATRTAAAAVLFPSHDDAGAAACRAGPRFAIPNSRARLVQAAHDGDYGRAIGAETRKPNYDWIRILKRPVPPNSRGTRLSISS